MTTKYNLFLFLLLLGCTSPSGEQAATAITDDLYTLETATEGDLTKAAANPTAGFSMEQDYARKVNGVIILKMNGKWQPQETFKDTISNSSTPGQKEYRYLGQSRELNKYLVAEVSSENYQTYLVDKTTGDITATWSEPALSPDGKYLANISPPIKTAPSGVQVWRVTRQRDSTSIEKHLQFESQDWKPFELYWESPRAVLVRVVPMEKYQTLHGEPKREDFSYVRLIIK